MTRPAKPRAHFVRPGAADASKPTHRETSPPARALVVDDDPQAARCIGQLLSGYELLRADSIASALPLIRRRPRLLLAFVDFDLPDGCALPILRELMRETPSTGRVLVSTRPDAVRWVYEGQVHAFVPKPFNFQEIQILGRAWRRANGA